MESVMVPAALAIAGMVTYALGVLVLRDARRERETAAALVNRLDYEVVAVDAEQAAPYRLVLPTWRDFAERVLADPGLAAFHDQVRRDGARFRTQYPGFQLFVRVKCLPPPG